MRDTYDSLLEQITLGELSPESPEVMAARQSDPEFDHLVADTLSVMEGLDRAAAEREAVLADAAQRSGEPGEDAVAAFVRDRVEAARPGAGGVRLRRMFPWIASAAAIVLIVGLSGLFGGSDPDPTPRRRFNPPCRRWWKNWTSAPLLSRTVSSTMKSPSAVGTRPLASAMGTPRPSRQPSRR